MAGLLKYMDDDHVKLIEIIFHVNGIHLGSSVYQPSID